MPENVNFKLHVSYLIDTIKKQSSGFPKAITELIMNSVDAGATEIDIQIEHIRGDVYKYKISDDGKGFTKKDIMTYFRYFGNPHEDNDAHYGCFRLGRGQLFSLSKSIWRSNNYVFSVDLDKALNDKNISQIGFDLYKSNQKVKGCTIEGYTYDDRNDYLGYDLESTIQAITEICLFVPIPININGVRVNPSVQDVSNSHGVIHFEDENAHYLFDNSLPELTLYNRGVKVAYAAPTGYLMNGSIITKHQLKLSLSRNEVLDGCQVYGAILNNISKINESLLSTEKDHIQVNEDFIRKLLIAQVKSDQSEDMPLELLESVVKYRCLTSNNASQISMLQIMGNKTISFRYENDSILICERIERMLDLVILVQNQMISSIVMELRNTILKGMYFHEIEECILKAIRELISAWVIKSGQADLLQVGQMAFYEIDASDPIYLPTYLTITNQDEIKSFSEAQQLLLKLSSIANDCIADAGIFETKRTIALGNTDDHHVLAWTNGEDIISVNSQCTTLVNTENQFKLFNIIIHEYCHENAFDSNHGHNSAFYEKYHDATMSTSIHKAMHQFKQKIDKILGLGSFN